MDYGGQWCERPFGRALTLWRDFPGGLHSDGTPVGEPRELTYARTILALADRWKKLPSEIENEPAETFRLLEIERLGVNPDAQRGGDPDYG